MSIYKDIQRLKDEEKKNRQAFRNPALRPQNPNQRRNPNQSVTEPNIAANWRYNNNVPVNHNESTGSLGPIDTALSGLYHFADSALMGVPGMAIRAANDGWSPYDIKETNTWAKVGGIIGEAAGFLVPIGVIGRTVGLPIKMLAGTGKTIDKASKMAGNVAATAARTGAKLVDDAGVALGKEAAEKELKDMAQKSISKKMNEAVESNFEEVGAFRQLWRKIFPDKPKKWIEKGYNPTVKESIATQRAVRESVEAGLRKDFADVLPADSEIFGQMSAAFLKGLKEGEHLNTVGSWIGRGIGAGSPGWLREKFAGYAGRYADMFLSFGIYGAIDEALKRKMEPEYEHVDWGMIAGDTAMFAALLPIIEAIPGGVAGAMTWKNYKNVLGIMRQPKYKDMSRAELTTYYDFIRHKMPGMTIGTLDDATMSIRKEGVPTGYNRDELAAGLSEWYAGASKKFFKEFRGEQAKNFIQSIPRLVAGGMYFGGAANVHDGFFGEQFRHHLKEDPWAVTTHILTGMFFTRHRKPLSKDKEGKWFRHKVHFKEEYESQLRLLTHMGYNAEGLSFYLNSISNENINFATHGLAYRAIEQGKKISDITQKYIDLAKQNEADNVVGGKLDIIQDKNLVEAYSIWRASQAKKILDKGEADRNVEKIESESLLESLTTEQRTKFSEEISNVVVSQKADGSVVRLGDITWNEVRNKVFDEKILNNHNLFFQNFLISISNKFSKGEIKAEIVDEKVDEDGNKIPGTGRVVNLAPVNPNNVQDIGELTKYMSIANRLIKDGKAEFAHGEGIHIDAKEMKNATGEKKEDGSVSTKYDDLSELIKGFEDKFGSDILGPNTNVNIDFNNLDITWNTMSKLTERNVMEKLIRIVNGDTEGMTHGEKSVHEILKIIFRNGYNENWTTYLGDRESGTDILRRGEGVKDSDKWEKEVKNIDDASDIMKVIQMAHELVRYTPLSSTLASKRTDGKPEGITLSDGRALLRALQTSNLITPGTNIGVLSNNFKRYLFERALDMSDVGPHTFALVRHVIDSQMAVQSKGEMGNVQLELFHPETIRAALMKQGRKNENEISELVDTYIEKIYNPLVQLKGLVKEPSSDGSRISEANIVEQATNPNVQNLLDKVGVEEFILNGAKLTEPNIQKTKADLKNIAKLVEDEDLSSAIGNIIQITNQGRHGKSADLKPVIDNFKEVVTSRRRSLSEKEKEVLDTLESALDRLHEQLVVYEAIPKSNRLSEEASGTLKEIKEGMTSLKDEVVKLYSIIDDNGNLHSRTQVIKDVGRLITNLGTDSSVKTVVAYSNLKNEIVREMGIKEADAKTLEQIGKELEKEGKYFQFLEYVRANFKGALDTLDRATLDNINKTQTEAYQEWLSHIQKAQFTIRPDTIARKYKGIFYDPVTRGFSEGLKQGIIKAWDADIKAGGTRNIRGLIERMIKRVEKEHAEHLEDFVREELPKVIHTIVSTEKKVMYKYDARTQSLYREDSYGSRGAIENYITFWHDKIATINKSSMTPEMTIVRVSRTAIGENGYIGDIAGRFGERGLKSVISGSKDSSEMSPKIISEVDRNAADGVDTSKIAQDVRERARRYDWIPFGVDSGGFELMIDFNGIARIRADFSKSVVEWYNQIKKIKEGNDNYINSIDGSLGKIVERIEKGEVTGGFRRDDIKNIMRWMYYYSSNSSGFHKIFEARNPEQYAKAQSELFKYSITAQGENASRLNSKLAEVIKWTSNKYKLTGKNKDLARLLDVISKYEKKSWKFDVSVIKDEGEGGVDTMFSTSTFLKNAYSEMAYKELKKLALDFKMSEEDIMEFYKVDFDKPADKMIMEFLEKVKTSFEERVVELPAGPEGERELLTGKYKFNPKTDKYESVIIENVLKKFKGRDIEANRYIRRLDNILRWREESIKELDSIASDVSAIDGVTYLSTEAARLIFGLNGFAIGDGFSGVKPIISHNSNEFFNGKGAANETFIGKTSFIYDPRVAEHLDAKGIDMMMGKSAAKSFSGTVQDVSAGKTTFQGLTSENLFERAVEGASKVNSFQLPISSIGVVYTAGSLHPAKAIPVVSIGMNKSEVSDYSRYMNLKDELNNIAHGVGELNSESRTQLVSAMVEQARLRGYDLDVGGGGLGVQLFKLGMDSSDPLIKREVIRIFHEATGAKLGAIEKDGAGVSVMIPEVGATLPIYKEFDFSKGKRFPPTGENNRRQIKYGGIKIPYDMGKKEGLFSSKDDLTLAYDGYNGQDIILRKGEHIDQTILNFIGKKDKWNTKVEKVLDEIDSMVDKAGLLWKHLSVADLHQLIGLRFTQSGNQFQKYEVKGPHDANKEIRLFIGDAEHGLTSNVSKILRSNFGKEYSRSKELWEFTRLLDKYNIDMAVPGTRIPSQSFSDVVINRLEGIYSRDFGNVVGSNQFDVITKHQGDYDIDKMFYYLDAPVSLIKKGIRNSGYNIEPNAIPKDYKDYRVDLLNNGLVVGGEADLRSGDGVEYQKLRLLNNKFLIGRINRLNYSLMALRESNFRVGDFKKDVATADNLKKYGSKTNSFDGLTQMSEKKMSEISQAISTLSTVILDPHKQTHKAAFADSEVLVRYLLFGDWPSNHSLFGHNPLKGTPSEGFKGVFGENFNLMENKYTIDNKKFILTKEHKEVLKDAYVIAVNTVGRAARVFSGVFDETGQRSPKHWEYGDIKDTIERFRENPTKYIFGNLAWKYRKNNDEKKRALFDLFVKTGYNYGEFGKVQKDLIDGKFNFTNLVTGLIKHDLSGASREGMNLSPNYKDFWNISPANIILEGMSPQNGKSIYSSGTDSFNRGNQSNYSDAAKELLDNMTIISAFSGERSLNYDTLDFLWRSAQSKIQIKQENFIHQEQKRDILWQVIEKELAQQERHLKYIKGNKYHNEYENEMVSKRVESLNQALSYIQNKSIHGEGAFDRINGDFGGAKSWADVKIYKSHKFKGDTYFNESNHNVVVYEVNPNITTLEKIEYNMLSKGITLKKGDAMRVNPGTSYVVLRNPIRNISVSNNEFLHGLSAFAASTTLTPESFRAKMDKNRVGSFYRDIDLVKEYIKDRNKALKKLLRDDPNKKDMHFATTSYTLNDVMRNLLKEYAPEGMDFNRRQDRLTDIFELLTLAEPLNGAVSRIKGLKIQIPVFLQNRDIFRAVSKFYIENLGVDGQEIVKKYLTRKSNFYRMFVNEHSDFTEIEHGLKDRLYSNDTSILPAHLNHITQHHNILNDIINTPLTRFNDYAFRVAFNQAPYGVKYNEFSRNVMENRTIRRSWSSSEDYIILKNYTTSAEADNLRVMGRYKTPGQKAMKEILCP